MIPRLSSALAVLVLAACLAGCAPDAAPAPSPTGFASEEEAFAAAEETYRAYVDALNRVDLSDPATFEDVYAWTTGDANAGERKSLTEMHAKKWRVSGTSSVLSMSFASVEIPDRIQLAACVDVRSVEVIDSAGASQVGSDRPEVQSELITFKRDGESSTGLKISELTGSDQEC